MFEALKLFSFIILLHAFVDSNTFDDSSSSMHGDSYWRNMSDAEFEQWYPKAADQCQLKLTGKLC